MLLACLRIVVGPGGANRRCDCDGYRPDTLGVGIKKIFSFLWMPPFGDTVSTRESHIATVELALGFHQI